jgi:hypothetical protein
MLELNHDVDMPDYDENDWLPLRRDNNDEWEEMGAGIHAFPPGEEGVLQSNAGGEAIMHQILEGMRPGCGLYPYLTHCSRSHRRGDPRTRSHRVQEQVDKWQAQMPVLVDAYLQYKNTGPVYITGVWPLNVLGLEGAPLT